MASWFTPQLLRPLPVRQSFRIYSWRSNRRLLALVILWFLPLPSLPRRRQRIHTEDGRVHVPRARRDALFENGQLLTTMDFESSARHILDLLRTGSGPATCHSCLGRSRVRHHRNRHARNVSASSKSYEIRLRHSRSKSVLFIRRPLFGLYRPRQTPTEYAPPGTRSPAAPIRRYRRLQRRVFAGNVKLSRSIRKCSKNRKRHRKNLSSWKN